MESDVDMLLTTSVALRLVDAEAETTVLDDSGDTPIGALLRRGREESALAILRGKRIKREASCRKNRGWYKDDPEGRNNAGGWGGLLRM